MRRWSDAAIGAALLALAGGAVPASGQDEDDRYGGLPPGEGRETVYAICSGCHSVELVKQQGMSRKRWDKTLVWMVEQQGMPELDAETRGLVLDYLANAFDEDGREGPGPGPFNRPQPLQPQQP